MYQISGFFFENEVFVMNKKNPICENKSDFDILYNRNALRCISVFTSELPHRKHQQQLPLPLHSW